MTPLLWADFWTIFIQVTLFVILFCILTAFPVAFFLHFAGSGWREDRNLPGSTSDGDSK